LEDDLEELRRKGQGFGEKEVRRGGVENLHWRESNKTTGGEREKSKEFC